MSVHRALLDRVGDQVRRSVEDEHSPSFIEAELVESLCGVGSVGSAVPPESEAARSRALAAISLHATRWVRESIGIGDPERPDARCVWQATGLWHRLELLGMDPFDLAVIVFLYQQRDPISQNEIYDTMSAYSLSDGRAGLQKRLQHLERFGAVLLCESRGRGVSERWALSPATSESIERAVRHLGSN